MSGVSDRKNENNNGSIMDKFKRSFGRLKQEGIMALVVEPHRERRRNKLQRSKIADIFLHRFG